MYGSKGDYIKRHQYCTINVIHTFKPRLHERFFACDGDAIFLKIVASQRSGENRMYIHPGTGDARAEKLLKENREKFKVLNVHLATNYKFVALPVREWLHMRL